MGKRTQGLKVTLLGEQRSKDLRFVETFRRFPGRLIPQPKRSEWMVFMADYSCMHN